MTPLLGLDNLLEGLTELRERRLLVVIKDIIKDTDEQPGEEIHSEGQKGPDHRSLWPRRVGVVSPSHQKDVFINQEALRTLFSRGFF